MLIITIEMEGKTIVSGEYECIDDVYPLLLAEALKLSMCIHNNEKDAPHTIAKIIKLSQRRVVDKLHIPAVISKALRKRVRK